VKYDRSTLHICMKIALQKPLKTVKKERGRGRGLERG
jgi:hypothetical protein